MEIFLPPCFAYISNIDVLGNGSPQRLIPLVLTSNVNLFSMIASITSSNKYSSN